MNFNIKYHLEQSQKELRNAKAYLLLYIHENQADGNMFADQMMSMIQNVDSIMRDLRDKASHKAYNDEESK